MEKWKIATISSLVLALLGFGVWQQNADKARLISPPPVPSGTPLPSPYIGKTLPAWNFKTWNQKPVPLASLEGKPAMVEIFRIECSHCQDAAPFLNALQLRYGPRGLKIVSIQSPGDFKDAANPETKWPDVQAWLKQKRIKYPVAFDQGSRYFQGVIKKQLLGGDAGKLLYPTIILLDKTGKVDFAQTGHDTGKAIALALEMEKRFPGSPDRAKNVRSLAEFLRQQLPELQVDGTLSKAFEDDLVRRLQGKE